MRILLTLPENRNFDVVGFGLNAVDHLIVVPEAFELLSGREELTTYRFNTGIARHTFCRHCGIHPFYVPRSDPNKIDVNARCLEVVDLSNLKPEPFDGQNWEESMKQRDAGGSTLPG